LLSEFVIYLDNSATTQTLPEVRAAMEPFLADGYGNASSVHSLGTSARNALEEAREVIANAIGAESREIVFTSGGTEANNWAVKSALFKHYEEHFAGKSWSDLEVLTSPIEHHSVLEPIQWMAKVGAHVSYAKPDAVGCVTADAVSAALSENTALVSLMMVNNELGSITNIAAMSPIVHSKGNTFIHTDAVQAFGKMNVNVRQLDVDTLALSAHKLHGPKGIGALYVRGGLKLTPLLHGGSQERNRRGGTEAVALAVGFAEAVKRMKPRATSELHSYLLQKLRDIPTVVLNSASDERCIDSIVNFTFTDAVLMQLDADTLIMRFDLEGIAVSNGAACTSGSQQPSHVLMALGKTKDVASKSIRVSLSRFNTREEIDRLIEVVRTIAG
jgi:cysteine desulfurase